MIDRRRFNALLTGTFFAVPASAERTYRIGMLGLGSRTAQIGASFFDELKRRGYIEGTNLTIDYRGGEVRAGHHAPLALDAQELVGFKPDLIVTSGPQPALAAKDATSTIPIVAMFVGDPVRLGLVSSLARPGGNITGVTTVVSGATTGKSLQLLKEMVPKATRIALLFNPGNQMHSAVISEQLLPVARQMGIQLPEFPAGTKSDIEPAINAAVQAKADALFVLGDPVLNEAVHHVTALAARARLPAIYLFRRFVAAGGLMSYGLDAGAQFRRAADCVDRILKGAKPADVPFEQPTKFELVINMKTAAELGLTVPQSLLLRADEVIR